MNHTFKKVALASALLASSAIVAPAMALTLATTGFENNAAPALQAPVSSSDESLLIGKVKYKFVFGQTGVTDPTDDTFKLVAVTFKAGAAQEVIRETTAAAFDDAGGHTVDLSAAADFDKVVFMLVPEAGDDSIDTVTISNYVLQVIPKAGRSTSGAEAVKLVNHAKNIAAGAMTDMQAAAIGTDLLANAFTYGGYAGPVGTKALVANKAANNNASAIVEYNTYITVGTADATPANGVTGNTVTGLLAAPTTAVTTDNGVVELAANATAGGKKTITVTDGAGVAFDEALDSFTYTRTGAGGVFDEAGNEAVGQTGLKSIAVDNLPAPALKTVTASQRNVLVTAGVNPLWGAKATEFGAADTITVKVKFASDMDFATLGTEDFEVAGVSDVEIDTVAADGIDNSTAVLTISPKAGKKAYLRIDPATGKLQSAASTAATSFTDVTVKFVVGTASKAKSSLGVEIAAASAATGVAAGFAPTTVASTADSDGNGYIDGITVDFGTAVSATTGLTLSSDNAAKDLSTVAGTFVTGSSNSKILLKLQNADVPADGLAAAKNDYTGDGAVDAADLALVTANNFNTGVLGADLPFTAKVPADTSVTYATVWDDKTTDAKKLASGNFGNTVSDGAAPVVTSVVFTADIADPTKGTVEVIASENLGMAAPGKDPIRDHLNALAPIADGFLLSGSSVPTINLNASITDDVDTDLVAGALVTDKITLDDLPASVVGKVLSFGVTTGVTDAAGNKLQVSIDAAKNKVALPADSGPALKTAELIKVDNKFNQIKVKFTQAVEAPVGQTSADRDGLFLVRAKLADNRTSDFVIAGDKVVFNGTDTVVLTLPVDYLPPTTAELQVDYNGANAAAIKAGAKNYVKALGTDGKSAQVEGGGLANAFNAVDVDTAKVTIPQTWFAANVPANTGKLFTQTIRGTVKIGPEAALDGTRVRADLVRVVADGKNEIATPAYAGAVGDGLIELNRAANESDTTKVQTIALNNKAVTDKEAQAFLTAKAAWWDAQDAFTKSEAKNEAAAIRQTKADALKKAEDALRAYGITNMVAASRTAALAVDGHKNAYVVVTNGAGKDAVASNNSSSNDNANVGRTATLVPSVANVEKNGTTIYPVRVSLLTGLISASNIAGINGVVQGSLTFDAPRLAEAASAGTHRYAVLDTAYATVKDGKYSVSLGMVEDKLTETSASLSPKDKDAFVLVSVYDPRPYTLAGDAKWLLSNSAEPNFVNYMPFTPDLQSAGTATSYNIDVNKVSVVETKTAGWHLAGITGTPALKPVADKAEKPKLDPRRLFVSVDPSNGDLIDNWAYDRNTDEQAFSLHGNKVELAFQLGAVNISNLTLNGGDAIAFNNGSGADAVKQNVNGVVKDNHNTPVRLFVPTTGNAPVAGTMSKGWHLITLQGDVKAAEFAAANKISAILNADAAGATTWFSGDADKTFKAGTGVFVYLEQDVANFAFK